MNYKSILLHEDFIINEVISIHYFEYMSDFSFEGESHDFWELLCVDKGEVTVMADNHLLTLQKGEIIFHKPNEFHSIKANGIIAPNLVVLSFECHSPSMAFYENKVLTIGETEKNLLATIITEANQAFSTCLNDPYLESLERKALQTFGAEQLIKLNLEHLLIQLYRRYTHVHGIQPLAKSITLKNDDLIYERIIDYLNMHLDAHLSIEQICRDNLISRSQLQKMFREKNNCGIIEFFSKLKIDTAKQLIRDQHSNFTQIADSLGYTSIHYFSRQFKKITGMTPSDYAYSIKILSEKPK